MELQLEAEYRQRLENVHTSVKKRLDYQVALADAKRQFHAEHMSNWIVEQVNKSITPELVSAGRAAVSSGQEEPCRCKISQN